MNARLKWWLFTIIVLVAAGLLAVLRPVTVRYRRDPDSNRVLQPIKRMWGLNIYSPSPDLRLGLDLRGGTQLRLQCQKSAVFTFHVPEILALKGEEASTSLQGEIGELLPTRKLDTVKREIEVTETGLRITTRVKDRADMARQKKIIDEVVLAKYPDAAHEKGSPEYVSLAKGQLEAVKQNLENRINIYGVAEPVFQVEEPDKILVELPGVKDPARAKALLQATAVLEFRHIPKRYIPSAAVVDPRLGEEVRTFSRKLAGGRVGEGEVPARRVLDESTLVLTGKDLQNNPRVSIVPGQKTAVLMDFKSDATARWSRFTRAHVGDYVAIVLDGRIISCPIIESGISGTTSITGGFDGTEGAKQAQDLVIKLKAGSLPVDIVPIEERVVSATLGQDSLNRSLLAGAFGFLLVLVFMVFYYRLPGVLACLALLVYCVLLLAALKGLDATLTLPGIFALILSIGMAVDANVIIFERLKEELRTGKTMRAAIEAGFKRAWTAILDANVCSILTGMVLYWLGTGPVKGFAITLVIGVAVSMFTAVTVTRLFMDIACGTRFASRPTLFGLTRKDVETAR